MNAFAFICIILAIGLTGLMIHLGEAVVIWAKRPREPRHQHKWKIIDHADVLREEGEQIPIARIHTLQCEGCGLLSSQRVQP